jgi:hypothetical protein
MSPSPFQLFDVSRLVLPHITSLFQIVLGTSAVFVTITTAIILYHWWRYSDSLIMTAVTVGSYVTGSAILLLVMLGSI